MASKHAMVPNDGIVHLFSMMTISVALVLLLGSNSVCQGQNTAEEIRKIEDLFGIKKEPEDAKSGDKKEAGEKKGDKAPKPVAPEGAEEKKPIRPPAKVVPVPLPVPNQPNQVVPPTSPKAFKLEIEFLRRAAKLTPEQVEHLETLDEKWMKKNVRPPIENMMNGVIVANGQASWSASRKAVVRSLIKEWEPRMTEEQVGLYASERKSRDAFRKEASVETILLLLDKHLLLREDQINTIRQNLIKSGIGERDYQVYLNVNGQYLPNLPESAVIKVLDKNQREIFRSFQQAEFGHQEVEPAEVIQ